MNKGYAVGFLLVLLVVILGLYVAFTGFMSSREALRARPTSAAPTRVIQVASSPTAEPSATLLFVPTPVPGNTVTPTVAVPPTTERPTPTQPAEPVPTQPPSVRPSDTPASPVQPPTPAPPPAYPFRLASPPTADPNYSICCYIFGTIRDAAGNGLEGIQVQAFNEWATLPPATTKGGSEAGQYNIIIGRDRVTWYVVVVDANGNRISGQAVVAFDPDVANGFRVDWQSTY